jgi:membrane protease YdiL (CAAX protease family)
MDFLVSDGGSSALLDEPQAEPEISLSATPARTSLASRKIRVIGLIVVLSVSFASSVIISLFALFGIQIHGSAEGLIFTYVHALAVELVALLLLSYVLKQNGTKLADIGLAFHWRDIKTGILLTIGCGIAAGIAGIGFHHLYQLASHHPAEPPSIPGVGVLSLWVVLFVAINPIFEELIVRAFMISELVALTGSRVLAVAASVALQTTYHLYQGVPYALTSGVLFLVFSIFYVRTRRIVPVILAHFLFDLNAMILYPMLFRIHG